MVTIYRFLFIVGTLLMVGGGTIVLSFPLRVISWALGASVL
ncbi:gp52 [Bacillus phage TP21-L]|uniref:Gp52 n=1 Tax=Bacillus phage TP21-L TaxID=565140 RepID=B8R861_9CAUD|nr:gp52 [Bacillus phage TP21-L]ACJ70578.1 gp52 [Bacillus phage TP21-L]